MEMTEILDSLNGLVTAYERHRQYIEKAKAQASTGKFNSSVIERVILDHEIKSSDVADQVGPLLPGLRALLTTLEADRARIEASRGGVDEQIQEFELRNAIGEISEEEFEREVADLRANQSSANDRISHIETELGVLNGALERWSLTAGPAGHYASPATAPAEPEAEAAVEEEPDEEEDPAAEADPSEHVGAHATRTDLIEDLTPVFSAGVDSPSGVRVSASMDEEIAIETSEGGEDVSDGPSADVQFGFDDDLLGNGAGSEVEIDLAGEGGASVSAGPSLRVVEPETGADAPRRALLLYQEGTAEEQIYPFTGDILTIGRGRENDIQIKNDSKVSRYHCKIFRRGNNFYIEDQKSSNGSLVNGELITDRRLFGGEEIVIGETFFRFRILE